MDDQQVGARVRFFREIRGWKQAALAQHCGWSAAKLSKLESGKQPMTVLELLSIAAALEIPVHYLASVHAAADTAAVSHLHVPLPQGQQEVRLVVTIRPQGLDIALMPPEARSSAVVPPEA